MNISIITPSFHQLDWLRLCVASVRDQVVGNADHRRADALKEGLTSSALTSEMGSHRLKKSYGSEGRKRVKITEKRKTETKDEEQGTKNVSPPCTVEHIIQDAGTPGIEDFAREIGADFYRETHLVAETSSSQEWRVELEKDAAPVTVHPLPGISPYRIAIYCEKDEGMYDALNRGFRRATGEVVAWLNCDEQYLPGTLEAVAQTFQQDQALEILWGDAILLTEHGEPVSYRRMVTPHKAHTIACGLGTLSCSMFFRSQLVRMFPFDDTYRSLGDADFLLRVQPWQRRTRCLSTPLAAFVLSANSQSHQTTASEIKRFQCTHPALPAWMTIFLRLHHGWRKLWAGAYGRHAVRLYLWQKNRCERTLWQGTLDWRWPLNGKWPPKNMD